MELILGYISTELSDWPEITKGVRASSIKILSTSSTIANPSFLKHRDS